MATSTAARLITPYIDTNMESFHIDGGHPLSGEITISGAKNAALPILFATLLTEEPVVIHNVPQLRDVYSALELLISLGAQVNFQRNTVTINTHSVNQYRPPNKVVKSMRASIWSLGPLMARFGQGELALPGGCAIGARPVDLHINGLKQLGAQVVIEQELLKAWRPRRLQGANIVLPFVSVGATVTIMSAATLAHGTTMIINAAREPEIIDTANFLNQLGAKIFGAGTPQITIQGVEKLGGGSYQIIPDRIETGTFLVAGALLRGDILCRNTQADLLESVLVKLRESGAHISTGTDWIRLQMVGQRPRPVDLQTAPYPGFPTDMQAPFTLLNMVAQGTGVITESIFENRFQHVAELVRMGGKAAISGNQLVCHGVNQLTGTSVMATDLRASATLVLAGCVAKGSTEVYGVDHVDRGYENIEHKLQQLGAKIERIGAQTSMDRKFGHTN